MESAALYGRATTHEQNCDLQLEELRQYATRRFDRVYEYVDRAVSGVQSRRPQLDLLKADARKRVFDAVLVWKLDRFADSLKHLLQSLEEFRALGIDFISLTEGIDITTPRGRLLFHFVGAVMQFERDLISERVRAEIARTRSVGKQIGRPRVQADSDWVIRLRGEGKSLRAIGRTLDIPVSRVRRALSRRTSADVQEVRGSRSSAP